MTARVRALVDGAPRPSRAGAVAALTLMAIAAGYWMGHRRLAENPPAPAPVAGASSQEQLASLAAQVEELRNRLNAGSSRASAPAASPPAVAAKDAGPGDVIAEVESTRAKDEERRRQYMAGVAQAFEAEKIDPAWATRASARVAATFTADPTVREIARDVQCRQQTCRIQISDEGRNVSARMPSIALRVADLFPSVSADYVDRGDGSSTMIVYMSTESSATAAPAK